MEYYVFRGKGVIYVTEVEEVAERRKKEIKVDYYTHMGDTNIDDIMKYHDASCVIYLQG